MTAINVVPLLLSLLGCLMLWKESLRSSDSWWLDLWAILTLAPLMFFLIGLALGGLP